jgi:ribonuclease HII
VAPGAAASIRERVLAHGGTESGIVRPPVAWRLRLSDATVTYWENGTLFSMSSPTRDPEVAAVWAHIASVTEPRFVPSNLPFMIGLDETGKSEVVGPVTLVGALVPSNLVSRVVDFVELAETKTRHPLAYWEDLFSKLVALKVEGLEFRVEKIAPRKSDPWVMNRLLDVTYRGILSNFFRSTDPADCQVVVDDYGVGAEFGEYLETIRGKGAEVIKEHHADDHHIAVRVASVVAKRERERLLDRLKRKPEFQVDGLWLGSGTAGTPKAKEWLKAWKATGRPWPWFIKTTDLTI